MKRVFIAILFSLILLQSCSNAQNEVCNMNCHTIDCYHDFASFGIIVRVINDKEIPVLLDDYKTYRLRDGKEYDFTNDLVLGSLDKYPVFSDESKSEVSFCGEYFEFVGIKEGKEIIKEKFLIKNNCCQLELIDGPLEIKVENLASQLSN